MQETQISILAYCKLILHAAKYPHAAVNGLLLAKKPTDSDGEDDKKEDVEILDAIPLFHQGLGLAPMLEIALNQVDSYCSKQGLIIAGYYQANEHIDSCSPDKVAYRIADKIHAYFPKAVLLILDNRKISPIAENLAYRLFTSAGDQDWREHKTHVNAEEQQMLEAAASLLEDKAREIVDFDNHLDDLRCDWRNLELNRVVQEM